MIKILIVEDSPRDAQLVLGELRDGGFEPVFERVQTAEAMRSALASQTWDVILSDFQMPKFTGLEALSILKETGMDYPFILLSGAIGEEVAAQIMKAGANDFILKANLSRLVPAIERELKDAENRKLKRQAEEKVYKLNKELELRVLERTAQLAKANATLNHAFERERLLRDILQEVSQTFDLEIILKDAVQKIREHIGSDRCLLSLYHPENPDFIQLAEQSVSSNQVLPIDPDDLYQSPIQLLKELIKNDPAKQWISFTSPKKFPALLKGYQKKYGIQSSLVHKISYRNITYGAIALHQCDESRVWSQEEITLMGDIGTAIGAAFLQTRLYQEEQQAKQEAEAANREKTRVLSFVSHDFKNPLAGISRLVGILENAKDDSLSPKNREIIGYIGEGVEQLRGMVTNILDKARLEQGQITPTLERIEPAEFIEKLKPVFDAMAAERNIEVHLDMDPTLTAFKADPSHLRQILTNLISNAVKYNWDNGQVFLKLYPSKDRQSAVIEVQDTGTGIPADKLPKLFAEYYRAVDMTQADQVEGTGLGLAFVKKLLELHDGQITVESEVGLGSSFKVLLPLEPSSLEQKMPSSLLS